MNELTPTERKLLELHLKNRGEASPGFRSVNTHIADELRQYLPDIDDVTIAKVMLAYAGILLEAAQLNKELVAISVDTVFVAAELASVRAAGDAMSARKSCTRSASSTSPRRATSREAGWPSPTTGWCT